MLDLRQGWVLGCARSRDPRLEVPGRACWGGRGLGRRLRGIHRPVRGGPV